jgi:hypothetical protein
MPTYPSSNTLFFGSKVTTVPRRIYFTRGLDML